MMIQRYLYALGKKQASRILRRGGKATTTTTFVYSSSSSFSSLMQSKDAKEDNHNNKNAKDRNDDKESTKPSSSSPQQQHQPIIKYDFTSSECNIPIQIQQQLGRNLYLQKNHPLCIVQEQIAHYFNNILPTLNEKIRTEFEKEQQQQKQKVISKTIRKDSNKVKINTNHILSEIYEKEYHHPPPALSTEETTTSSLSSIQLQQNQYFTIYDTLSPIVTTKECFDELLIDTFHPSRHKSDTYYIDDKTVLRPHTSTHQISLIRYEILQNKKKKTKKEMNIHLEDTFNISSNNNTESDTKRTHNTNDTDNCCIQFLCVGDVYRRDEIDKSHYPIFHQMEGVKLFHIPYLRLDDDDDDATTSSSSLHNPYNKIVDEYIIYHLKYTLESMIRYLFQLRNVTNLPIRWRDDNFPFTDPSYELDIYYNNEWMEILGCGIIKYELLEQVNYYYDDPDSDIAHMDAFDIRNTVQNERHISKNILNYNTHIGWAFGIGLERIAMILFQIPDIRLFWSNDQRFLQQFVLGDLQTIPNFQPYSKYPPCIKDISFWISNYEKYHSNDTYEIIRTIGGDLIEKVELIDTYTRLNKKNIDLTKVSHCYRITYRSMDRSLTNEEIDILQEEIRKQVVEQLKVELR